MKAKLTEVVKAHAVTRGGISTSYFGPTLGWWECSCGKKSPSWEDYYRDRSPDWPAEHVADRIAKMISKAFRGDS